MKRIILFFLSLFMTGLVHANHYYMVLYSWDVKDEFWYVPHDPIGAIDIRTIPQMSQRGGVPGYAIASYKEYSDFKDAIYLGDSLDSICVVGSGETVREYIYKKFSVDADPLGLTGPKPLMPDKDMKINLFVGDETVESKTIIPEVSPEWGKIEVVIQESYRQLDADAKGGFIDSTIPQKSLGFWKEKYGIDESNFIPADMPKVEATKPETTISDNFNCADSPTHGCQLAWTVVKGDWGNEGNLAKDEANNGLFSSARANTALSGDDNYCQDDVVVFVQPSPGNNAYAGCAARFSGSAETYYMGAEHWHADTTQRMNVSKVVAGTFTLLFDAVTPVTFVSSDSVKLEVSGSSLKVYLNGTLKIDTTDTSITAGTSAGIMGRIQGGGASGDVRVDNFIAGDLAAASPSPSAPYTFPALMNDSYEDD